MNEFIFNRPCPLIYFSNRSFYITLSSKFLEASIMPITHSSLKLTLGGPNLNLKLPQQNLCR